MKVYEIAVIGGGASGLMAAVSAAEESRRGSKINGVILLEGNQKLGKKLLATGNGRCNLTNMSLSPDWYFGDRDFIAPLLEKYNTGVIRHIFQDMGLLTRPDEAGRVYPMNAQAAAVLEVLRGRGESLGVEFRLGFPVVSVRKSNGLFSLVSETGEEIQARKCILASGGMASPKHSCGQMGYEICRSLGHRVTPLYPALVQMTSQEKFLRELSGIRSRVRIALLGDKEVLAQEEGELLFGNRSLSGICVFQLSLLASQFFAQGSLRGKKYRSLSVLVDFLPDLPEKKLLRFLGKMREENPDLALAEFLTGVVNMKLGREIIKALGYSLSRPLVSLQNQDLQQIAGSLKHKKIEISGVKGFEEAQITAGGVPLKELWLDRMESKIVPGLYLCGELLNVHGACGGYNLHFAWLSGRTAGLSAARKDEKNDQDNRH